jgi:hypothetical protein
MITSLVSAEADFKGDINFTRLYKPTERVRQLVKIWISLPLSHVSLSFLAWGHSGALLSEQIGESSRATA